MSTWWEEFSERKGFPQGFPDFIQYLNQVKGWSKERCFDFALMYKAYKYPEVKKGLDKEFDILISQIVP